MMLTDLNLTVPRAISANIEQFRIELLARSPVYLPVEPVKGVHVDHCFPVVKRHVAQYGGELQHGWLIWENDLWLEAIFHGVWVTPEKELVDISPKPDGERRILFAPDAKRTWTGQLVVTRRSPKVNDSNVAKALHLFHKADEIHARYAPGQPVTQADTTRIVRLRLMANMSLTSFVHKQMGIGNCKQNAVNKKVKRKQLKKDRQRRRTARRCRK